LARCSNVKFVETPPFSGEKVHGVHG
jgi:hypothetical protein